MKAALLQLGQPYTEINTNDGVLAWSLIDAPAVLCVNRWRHWVCIVGKNAERIQYFDSDGEPHLVREHHVISLSRGRFMKRWKAAKRVREQDPAFYGLLIHRRSLGRRTK